MKNILFVCTGNTCRSPMAEAIFLKEQSGKFEVKSAGIHAIEGMPMSEGAQTVLSNRNMIDNHKSSVLSRDLIDWADVVLTMTENHRRSVIELYPENHEKIYTLKEYILDDPETIEKIDKLKHHMAQLELKRASFLANNQDQVERYNKTKDISKQQELEQALLKELQPEQEAIAKLMAELPSFDIADPYMASVEVYDQTFKELEESVKKLLKKFEEQ
ncbi:MULTISPECIES: low molecular weight protein arginine phosphatase [Bacillaceae]|uniref:Low molecular weight protein arginine phosphatase n=1 Tax=Evansella alkalicola TaxID=745819 RepID=A0ABS6K0J4_9BACI|nr:MULTISPECIES: low molecular weight protein arginine phosphatase [Bacillaceae]MBU9724367.1 low molecular weight protein arginine phosphatase [Bacillus alkalicola]